MHSEGCGFEPCSALTAYFRIVIHKISALSKMSQKNGKSFIQSFGTKCTFWHNESVLFLEFVLHRKENDNVPTWHVYEIYEIVYKKKLDWNLHKNPGCHQVSRVSTFSEQSNLKSQIMTVWMWEFREILNTKLQKTPTSLRKQTVTWIESFIYLFIYLFFPKS